MPPYCTMVGVHLVYVSLLYHPGYTLYTPYHPVYRSSCPVIPLLPVEEALGSRVVNTLGKRPLSVLKLIILLGLMGSDAQSYSVSLRINEERSDSDRVFPM